MGSTDTEEGFFRQEHAENSLRMGCTRAGAERLHLIASIQIYVLIKQKMVKVKRFHPRLGFK